VRSLVPEVSVVIPAYDAGRTIDTTLRSVFAQTFRDFEVLVVDDGSRDDTRERVAAWGPRVSYQWEPHGGPARARNRALASSTGRLIAFLDADDAWLPRKLERQVAYFRQYPGTGLLHTAAIKSRSPATTILNTPDATPADRSDDPPSMQFEHVFHDRDVSTLTVMVPRDVLADVGGFDERRELYVEDWDLWLRIAARYPVGYLPMALAVRRAGGRMSSDLQKTFRGQQLVLDRVAPWCGLACARHRGNPRACIDARRHRLYIELAYDRWRKDDLPAAREAFARASALKPLDVRAHFYHAAARLGQPPFEAVRAVRRLFARRPSAVDLIHDTTYRRTRRAIIQAVHDVDDVVCRITRSRTRILFEAASPMSLAVFQPVLARLKDDPRLEFWFTTSDDRWTARSIFGDTARIVAPATARWMKFDAYINTDFWNITWLPRRTRRVHLFHGVAGKYGLDAPSGIAPTVAAFDRLFFPNRDRLERYAEAGLVDPDSRRAALIGYPKVDCLVDGSLDRRAILEDLGLDPRVPTILYAPTWSPFSSLATMGERIMTTLRVLGANVIVKLHDRSNEPTKRGSGGIDWRVRLDPASRDPRVHVATGADASPYMAAADALVTDHSSVGFEFMLLDRPIVIIDCPQLIAHASVNPQKVELLRSAADVASKADQIGAAVRAALNDPATHSERRKAIAGELFYAAGGATERAVRSIYELLELPLPQPQSASARAEIARPIPTFARTI